MTAWHARTAVNRRVRHQLGQAQNRVGGCRGAVKDLREEATCGTDLRGDGGEGGGPGEGRRGGGFAHAAASWWLAGYRCYGSSYIALTIARTQVLRSHKL